MENKAHAMAAGIFVVVLTALVLGLAAWLTRDTGVRDTYEISTREAVTGLQAQAPVRFRGVDVGKVSTVGFDPKLPGNVLLKLEIDRAAPITTDTFATLSFQGVTGLSFIQLADDGRAATRLKPNEDNPPRIPLRPGLLAKLEEKGEVILARVEEVTGRVNKLLGDDNQKRIADALESISHAANGTNQLVARLDKTVATRIDPALSEATVALKGVQQTASDVSRTVNEFGRTAQRLNAPDGPVDRLSEGVDSLSAAADQFGRATLPRINRVADEATRTVKSLTRAINELTENPQALVYGEGKPRPGPGEPGFQVPGATR
ncbi:MlaD family protein [Ramlibacter sp. XY19]|uniref:MlaD family protein n=1 Tax=Ramlibacter paludis TaxID=2908000 RepID=UPI0023DAF0D7|nr:MlaD family protein [Ramlibacter paludis]MCG2595554.1 MlaD family protein [Ramlibacter paludis]